MEILNRKYIEQISIEYAACLTRERDTHEDDEGVTCSIASNVKYAIEYAIRTNKVNNNIIY